MDFQIIFRKNAGRVQPIIQWDDFNDKFPMGISFSDGITPDLSVTTETEKLANEYLSLQSSASTKDQKWAAYRAREHAETEIYKLAKRLH